MTSSHPAHREGEHFIDRLALERIDRDIFTGWCHAGAPLRAFGGQVAAQALIAASTTVDDPGRSVHSLHAYFLRPGSTTEHIVYLVDRIRDTGTFSTRRVRAMQDGEAIFVMSASFALPEPGIEHQEAMPEVPAPEDCPEVDLIIGRSAQMPEAGYPGELLLDLRQVPDEYVRKVARYRNARMTWVRTREALPQDPVIHTCTLAYFSDLTLIGTILRAHGEQTSRTNLLIASIDHAMWFHAPFRADEWLLFEQDSPVARSGKGLSRGEFYRQDGTLVASAVQEALLRVPRPKQ